MAEIVVVEPSIASTSRGHGSNQNNNGTKPLSMKSITSGRDYVPEPFDSEKLPVTLRSEIQRFLRVANLIDAQEPRVACLCRLYAFEVAHDLDRNSSGRGVRKFKAALLQRVEQDEEVTYRKRKERNDVREVGRVYREYKDFIIEHGGESTLENREALIKAGAIAAVLYEVSNILTKAAGTQTLPMAEWEEVQQELIHQAGQQELLHPEDPYFNPDLVHPEEFEGNPEEPKEDPQMDLEEESEDDSEEDPEEEEQDEMSDEGPIDDSDDGEDPSVIDGQYEERDFSAPRLLPSYREYRHPNGGPLWRYTPLKPIPHVPSTRPTYDLGQSSQSSFPGTARGTLATSTILVLAAQVSRLETQTLASNMDLTSLIEVVRAMPLHIRSPEEDCNLDEEAIDITRAELVESHARVIAAEARIATYQNMIDATRLMAGQADNHAHDTQNTLNELIQMLADKHNIW